MMKALTRRSVAVVALLLIGAVAGGRLATASAEDASPDLSCDQIVEAMKATHYGSASYMRMLDQYNRICLEVKSGCASIANLDRQAATCRSAGMYFEYYTGPSSCRQVRCSDTPPVSSSSAPAYTSSAASQNGPCPNGDQLTAKAIVCRNRYERFEYFTENGCRQLRCIPNIASQASCPTPDSLREKANECKRLSKDYESYTVGVCKIIRCLDETIGSSSSCASDDDINNAAVQCSRQGMSAAVSSDVRGCRHVRCLDTTSSATSSCPSDADLDDGIQVCRQSGLPGTTMLDENGCRKVLCQSSNTSARAIDVNTDCGILRDEIVWMLNRKQNDTAVFAAAKESFVANCQQRRGEPPAAGFEDAVLTADDLSAVTNPFPDTNTASLDGKAAVELYRRGVIGGFPDGTFRGDKPVNRAEAAKFLLLACAKETDAPFSGKLRDIADGQWYTPFVEAAAAQGIIAGYPDGSFKPANTVIRAEFLKMLSKACSLEENLPYSYKDVSSTDWFAAFAGIAQTYSVFPDASGLLVPGKVLSRNDVAVAIYQYLSHR